MKVLRKCCTKVFRKEEEEEEGRRKKINKMKKNDKRSDEVEPRGSQTADSRDFARADDKRPTKSDPGSLWSWWRKRRWEDIRLRIL